MEHNRASLRTPTPASEAPGGEVWRGAPPAGADVLPSPRALSAPPITADEFLARRGYGHLQGPGRLMKLALALRESRAPP